MDGTGRYLLLDMGYLTHRAHYAMGALSHGGTTTGCAYGTLLEVRELLRLWPGSRPVFFFDHPGPRLRQLAVPTYKASRAARYAAETAEGAFFG